MSHSTTRALSQSLFTCVLSLFAVNGQSVVFAQIVPDRTTATEVKGNAIAPVGVGTVNGGNLYHSFDKFNVPNTGVVFNTGNSSVNGANINNIINRVTGDTSSQILGTIESRTAFPNANLFLLNPNGVVFGKDAKLDIGGSFNVSTGTGLGFGGDRTFSVDKASLEFPSGDPQNIKFGVNQPAAIINQGNLSVDAGKNITFTAGAVVNSGVLTAPSGNVALTSVAGGALVDLRSPDLVLGLSVIKDAVPINWNGEIATLPKLAELLTGKVEQGDRVVVKPDGTLAIVATPAADQVPVTNGTTVVSGAINTSSVNANGGNIGIFGDRVALINSQISATGVNGGNVLIGGDLQGNGVVPNAEFTYFDSKSVVDVSALTNGNGGKAIIWGDRVTQFFGTILSQGGELSGDGGFVEVSGKENLLYRGNVDTSATNGNFGTLLLDPTNITIISSSIVPAPNNNQLNVNVPNVGDPAFAIFFNDVSTSNFTIDNTVLNSATSNIILQARNDINVNASVNVANPNISFTAQAGNNINVNNRIETNRGNISLFANNGATATGTGSIQSTGGSNIFIRTNGADFIATGVNFGIIGNSISTSSFTGGGNIDINVTGFINAPVSFVSLTFAGGSTQSGNSGNISLKALGDITVGPLQAPTSGTTVASGSDITLDAGGNITIEDGSTSTFNSTGGKGGNVLFKSGGSITALGGRGINAGIDDFGIQTGNAIFTAGNVTFIAGTTINTNEGIVTATATRNTSNAGNISFTAGGSITATEILVAATFGSSNGSNVSLADLGAGAGNGGNISLISNTGAIVTGDLFTSGATKGGDVLIDALTQIDVGRIDSRGTSGTGGNVTLDPIGNVTFTSINATGNSTVGSGGNINIVSTGGNVLGTGVVTFTTGDPCAGATLCTNGAGKISIQHGITSPFDLNSFLVGGAVTNGTFGSIIADGASVALTPVSNRVGLFTQGNVSINPGGGIFIPPSTESPSTPTETSSTVNPINPIIIVSNPPVVVTTSRPPSVDISRITNQKAGEYLAEGKYEEAVNEMEKGHISELENYLGKTLTPLIKDLDQIQQELDDISLRTGSDTTVVYPLILSDRLELLIIPPKGKGKPFREFVTAAKESEITPIIQDFSSNIRDTNSQDYLEQSQKLYNWLVRPYSDRLEALQKNNQANSSQANSLQANNKQNEAKPVTAEKAPPTLVFVMDGGLRVIPVAALHDGKQFLIEKYALANLPYLRANRLESRDRRLNSVLAMGLTESVQGFSALPSVKIEVSTIGSKVLSGDTYLDKEFTVDNLQSKRQQGNFAIVHLATHAKFNSSDIQSSFIQFWNERLTLDRIPSLRFDSPLIEMLTLSACQTSVGQSLGLGGLAVSSGARSVLASLWEVSDIGTAPLMIEFYNSFPDNITKAIALQKAQVNLLRGTVSIKNGEIIGIPKLPAIPLSNTNVNNINLQHPFFWSSFILIGNWL